MASSVHESEKETVIIQIMSWPLEQAQSALCESPFNRIPDEILLHIFQFLSVPDLCRVSLVCRSFKMISDQDEIWKAKSNSK